MEAYNIKKVKVESSEDYLSGEYTLVEPHDPSDPFLVFVLSKRFAQVESIIRTAAKNVLKKLSEVYFVERVTISEYATLERIHIYLWQTNTGSKVYIIPPDLVLFETKSGNKYIVRIDIFKFFASLPYPDA